MLAVLLNPLLLQGQPWRLSKEIVSCNYIAALLSPPETASSLPHNKLGGSEITSAPSKKGSTFFASGGRRPETPHPCHPTPSRLVRRVRTRVKRARLAQQPWAARDDDISPVPAARSRHPEGLPPAHHRQTCRGSRVQSDTRSFPPWSCRSSVQRDAGPSGEWGVLCS